MFLRRESFTNLLSSYDSFQASLLQKFEDKMAMVVSKSRSAFHLISESFLQEAPIKFTPPDASSAPFRLLSQKKDLSQVARRYTMGVQSKSLKLVMNPDLTMSTEQFNWNIL